MYLTDRLKEVGSVVYIYGPPSTLNDALDSLMLNYPEIVVSGDIN